jgi:hypothetical protein
MVHAAFGAPHNADCNLRVSFFIPEYNKVYVLRQSHHQYIAGNFWDTAER